MDIYDKRKQACLRFYSDNPAPPSLKGFLYEFARLAEVNRPLNIKAIESALEFIDRRLDCSDFVLLGILRLVLQFGDKEAVPKEIMERAHKTILSFKYWPDERGQDSMCTWTENHQILFSVCEYLAGMMFPDRVFANSGMSGREKMAKARPRLIRWMQLRFRTGFNEWLSNVYYDEDIAALVTLADFCDDALLARGAHCTLDLLFYDMALNSFCGTFGATHGRSYEKQKKSGLRESTADIQKLVFGMGVFGAEDSMSAIHMALSANYRLPAVIFDVATDRTIPEMLNKQRMGIRIEDAERWGIGFQTLDDGMTLLSFEAYTHPKTFGLFVRLLDAYNWWDNEFLRPFKKMRKALRWMERLRLTPIVARLLEKDISRNMREEVHTLTYRTPDYMLSATLDYRKGYGGDQQHIWQATLSEEAVCFTTHPGSLTHRSPDYWTGSGFLPRVAMYKNVLICVYKISSMPGVYVKNKYDFTHAYFPKDKFDEVVEQNGWIFGRKGKGYIALYSQKGYRWQEEGPDRDREIIADGKTNIWLCEMGREQTHGTFRSFQETILRSALTFKRTSVSYHSPLYGKMDFGWRGEFRIKGKAMPLRHEKRYENPFSDVDFDPDVIEVKRGSEWLCLEVAGFKRTCSSTI